MSHDLCLCPDGIVRPKLWYLWTEKPGEFQSVCGKPCFGDNTKTPRVPGSKLPHCFTEKRERVNCPKCRAIMEKEANRT